MSQLRAINARTLFPSRAHEPRIGPDNLPPCRVCGGVVRYPGRTLCSRQCREVVGQSTAPAMQRQAVRRRDKGFCALCGCDTEKLKRIARSVTHLAQRGYGMVSAGAELLNGLGFSGRDHDLWEMDHVIAVVENGGLTTDLDYIRRMVRAGRWAEVGLENLRTLCIPCHKIETAALARRRAKVRRDAKATLFKQRGVP